MATPRRIPQNIKVPGRRLVVADCETNGLYGDVRILSLALVELRRGIVADSKFWLVNPGNVPMNKEAFDVNGLSRDLLADAAHFDEIVDEVTEWLTAPEGETLTLIGHKVSFDADKLAGEFHRLGVTLPPVQLLDTSQLAEVAQVIPERRSLASLLDTLGLTNTAPHTALGDTLAIAAAAVELMHRIVETRPVGGLTQVLDELCTTFDAAASSRDIDPSLPAVELSPEHLAAHLTDLSDGRRRASALDVCLAEQCDLLATRMEDGIATDAHSRQVITWALHHLDHDEELSRVTVGRLLRGIGQALRRSGDVAYVTETYQYQLDPYLESAGECRLEDACEKCAAKSGTCDYVAVLRRCVDALIFEDFDPFAKPSKMRVNEFLPGFNPATKRNRGRPKEGFYGELRRRGHFDAAGYGAARIADVRRVEGGREWAYALLRKSWDDGCRTPRLTEMLASMTVVDGKANPNADGTAPEPKDPAVAAIALIDECLNEYANQSGPIFVRLSERRARLVRLRDSPPRTERDPAAAKNLRAPHPTILGRVPAASKSSRLAMPRPVVTLTTPRSGPRRAK